MQTNVHKGGCGTHRTKNNSCIPRSKMLKRLSLVYRVYQGKINQVPAQHTKNSRWSFKTWCFPWKENGYFAIKCKFIVCVKGKQTDTSYWRWGIQLIGYAYSRMQMLCYKWTFSIVDKTHLQKESSIYPWMWAGIEYWL